MPETVRVVSSLEALNTQSTAPNHILRYDSEHTLQLYIDGEYVEGSDGQTFEVVDPRTEEVMAHCAQANADDVDKAVMAARKAFDKGEWTRMGGAVSFVHFAVISGD